MFDVDDVPSECLSLDGSTGFMSILFSFIDKDSDGCLTKKELQKAIKKIRNRCWTTSTSNITLTTDLSFYVTKTVLVGPKWFWSDHNDLVMTKKKWSRPKWIGQVQMWFILVENHNLDLTNSFWLIPNHYGQVQINLVRPKPFWTDQNCFGNIEDKALANKTPS